MKNIFFIILIFTAAVSSVFSQEMMLPAPIENKFFDASVGDWVSDEYEFMGMKWIDETTVNWVLNKQFLEMKVKSKSDKDMTYEQLGYMTTDKEGNTKIWFFDIWGMEGVTEFTGKTESNSCSIEGGNKWVKNKVKMIIENGVMTQEMKYTMTGAEGKEVSGEMKVVSRKK